MPMLSIIERQLKSNLRNLERDRFSLAGNSTFDDPMSMRSTRSLQSFVHQPYNAILQCSKVYKRVWWNDGTGVDIAKARFLKFRDGIDGKRDESLNGLTENQGNGLLHCAAGGGHLDLARMLVDKYGLETNVSSKDGSTVLHAAVCFSNYEVVPEMLKWLVNDCQLGVIFHIVWSPGARASFVDLAYKYGGYSLVRSLVNLETAWPEDLAQFPNPTDTADTKQE